MPRKPPGAVMSGDDLGFVSGRLQGILDQMAQDRDQRAEDKRDAIVARDQKHAENQAWQNVMTAKIDTVTQLAGGNDQWVQNVGKPLAAMVDRHGERLNALEDAKIMAHGKARGAASTWGFIGAVGTAFGGILTAAVEYGDKIVDAVKHFLSHQGGGAKAKGAAAGGALALALGLVAVFEGTKTHSYLDVGGVPTICTGHTGPDVALGQTATADICRDLLAKDMAWAFAIEDKALTDPTKVPIWTRAAMGSFIYNLGGPTWLSSPMPALINLGKFDAACNALLPYNMAPAYDPVTGKVVRDAAGRVVKKVYLGLVRRREAERHLCLGEEWSSQ